MTSPERRWTQHTRFHCSYELLGDRLHYWPTTHRFRWRGETYLGDAYDFVKRRETAATMALRSDCQTDGAYPKKRYGVWVWKPTGDPYNPEQCAEEVRASKYVASFKQCSRQPGHGDRQLFCKQHAKRHPEES